ncbi:MAG: histidine--tRNA ligase [Candidatus Dormibacteraeota bacterium]|nr:histidine--tRNA ligase [Candidatus Dormibacteraeota bacterium]MBO0744111.1 histidine--tRNA ligase [Candidatus Dormibacteraeota bacterium]
MPRTQPIRAARGVRDLLPDALSTWREVLHAARRQAERYGYQEIEVPVIEQEALVERGVGGDTDVVRKEIYRIQPMAEGGGTPLVLRPEATAGMVRAYFEGNLNQGPQPVRLWTAGAMFRHDRPQAGRYRQFQQYDVEVIGDPGAAFDAEVVELTWDWYRELGVEGLTLELNSIGDPRCRPGYLERLRAYFRPYRDRLGPDDQRRLETNPLRLLDSKEPELTGLKEEAPRITDALCEECAAHWAEVQALLDAAGIRYRLNPYLVRGLDYYTRTVWEYQHEALGGAQNSLGGGGRYDGLAEALGYPPTPAVGFAGGLDRIVMVLDAQRGGARPQAAAALLLLPDGEGLDGATAAVARCARTATSVAADYSRRSLRAKMRGASRSGARWVAIMNTDEASRRVVQLRELDSGEQREVGWEDLPRALTSMDPPGDQHERI